MAWKVQTSARYVLTGKPDDLVLSLRSKKKQYKLQVNIIKQIKAKLLKRKKINDKKNKTENDLLNIEVGALNAMLGLPKKAKDKSKKKTNAKK